MSKLITAKIDVTKIVKALLFKGTKGTYLNLTIWQNDKPDQFGNEFSIQQTTKKDEPKIYLGEGKFYAKKETDPLPDKQGEYQGSANKEAIVNKAKEQTEESDDLPF